jgi:hypothetical protein
VKRALHPGDPHQKVKRALHPVDSRKKVKGPLKSPGADKYILSSLLCKASSEERNFEGIVS